MTDWQTHRQITRESLQNVRHLKVAPWVKQDAKNALDELKRDVRDVTDNLLVVALVLIGISVAGFCFVAAYLDGGMR